MAVALTGAEQAEVDAIFTGFTRQPALDELRSTLATDAASCPAVRPTVLV